MLAVLVPASWADESTPEEEEGSVRPLPPGIAGRVVDNLGDALPGVSISLSMQGRPPEVVTTNAHGEYALGALIPGLYCLEAALFGFLAQDQDVLITPDFTERLDLSLAIASTKVNIHLDCNDPWYKDPARSDTYLLLSRKLTDTFANQ